MIIFTTPTGNVSSQLLMPQTVELGFQPSQCGSFLITKEYRVTPPGDGVELGLGGGTILSLRIGMHGKAKGTTVESDIRNSSRTRPAPARGTVGEMVFPGQRCLVTLGIDPLDVGALLPSIS
jgi:hypothetical protein